ncbi:PREDICTED: ran GTPase-activating protein 1-like isoform X1 [Acropora digitifera]|uniref:ran GTPase-activating protein 1-like isoform X1 n=1 Tax=Acropora digitifera TaxID=70779 RepID=UPI00077A698C|nr:PREDICTED: ran GTPase-activating protein 1-like isoform X1 [Acropora digitifera]
MADTEKDVQGVAELLAKTTVDQVNIVSFKGKGLKLNSSEDAVEVVDAIKASKDIQALCMEGNTIGVEAAKAIGEALSTRQEFEIASWSDIFTGRLRSEIPLALGHLSDGIIAANAKLTELDLSDNAFGPDGVKACVRLLTSCACYSLTTLKLNNNGLGIGGGKILSKALIDCHKFSSEAGNPLQLKVFISGRNRLENPGAKSLAEAFQIIGTLEELQMPQNGIQHEGIAALAEAFKSNPNLRILNLNDNTFTAEGAKAMAEVLPSLKSLEVINFGDCLVKTEGAKELAKSLRSGVNNLQELNLSYGEINKEGALAIVEALESKDCLKKLELNGNAIGDDGIKEVRGWLESNGCLHTLGSMKDDEGESDEDEEKNDEGEEDELGGESNESDEGEDVAELEVTGVGLKPQSPLLGTDAEVESELMKVANTEAVRDFLKAPTLDKLKKIPTKHRSFLIAESLKEFLEDAEKIARFFVSICVTLQHDEESLLDCSDAILKTAFESSECKEMGLVSFLLIHMGLLKVREPQERMTFLSSLLRLRLFKDSYLRKTKFSDITTLGSKRS